MLLCLSQGANNNGYHDWSGPMSGGNKPASGTNSACHYSRTGTATRVARTDDYLIMPDSENTSEPSVQVSGRDQPEIKKQRQWSYNNIGHDQQESYVLLLYDN